MNAKEAYELSSRGAQNQAEQAVRLACEKGLNECALSREVYLKCKEWIEMEGYRATWFHADGRVGITWEPEQ